ncbi:hypothetical protein LSUE1_G008802 [Lachnellula suecica]|uniref:AAA+ ATPase lid domain-containing protein n=1 Tax=Lachnellula suecica TaxID=602035 RepID=A0A8T9BTF9_9HELO|nr:hypothetical protein LSUE1_G008802 [Lachnellula suecica]
MHPGKLQTQKEDEFDTQYENGMVKDNQPPEGDFLLLLPSNVYGFNLQEKKWSQLQVDNTSPVDWDTRAFESLVVDPTSKLLIQALVTNQVAAEKGTDVMSGKGNGLIVLLHGVAELAKKPLYRVTCGDIGTDPEGVEKARKLIAAQYLKVVLNLGKVWNCVVLLDEADVFLEQRTLTDLQRNALVSGILILTSNRVGTFDEAFKSRIQLSLHYEDLTEPQRGQIWKNFIERLESFGTENIDTEGLRANVKRLAKHTLNGRQIRNAITTARQLAMFEKRTMDFKDVEKVIEVANKFEKYLLGVNDGMSDAKVAREDRVRLSNLF